MKQKLGHCKCSAPIFVATLSILILRSTLIPYLIRLRRQAHRILPRLTSRRMHPQQSRTLRHPGCSPVPVYHLLLYNDTGILLHPLLLFRSLYFPNLSHNTCDQKFGTQLPSSSVQFRHSVVDSLWPHGLQYARLPCPSPTPVAYSNSCPLSQWHQHQSF